LLAHASCNNAAAAEDPCASAQTTKQINECKHRQLERADSELNATYQKVLTRLSAPDALGRPQDEEKKSVVEAQRHWVKFREANCFAVWSLNADGTVRTALNIGCLEELAVQREQQLRKWFLAGAEDSEK
jgi:uncharacterized protein YecT (DUF1311 family)